MPLDSEVGEIHCRELTKIFPRGAGRSQALSAFPFFKSERLRNSFRALDEVSFHVSRGESFALVGANGAGKSTLLKCLSGLIEPSHGSATVGGRISAMIELAAGFHPDLSARDNARFQFALEGFRGSEAELLETVEEFADLHGFMDTPVKRFSSGMVARLGFAVASAMPGDVIIVDEVLSVGDVSFQRKCHARMKELRAEGRTILLVSHNEWVIKQTCERGLLLDRGSVQAIGEIDEVMRAYWSRSADTAEAAHSGGAWVLPTHIETVSQVRDSLTPFTAVVRVEVDPRSPEPVLGLALCDASRMLIWAVYSDDYDVALRSGTNEVAFELAGAHVMPGHCVLQAFGFDRTSPMVEGVIERDLLIGTSVVPGSDQDIRRGIAAVSALVTLHPSSGRSGESFTP